MQRLAIQGAEIDAKNDIIGTQKEVSNEEWSITYLKDQKCSVSQEYLMFESLFNLCACKETIIFMFIGIYQKEVSHKKSIFNFVG